MIKSYRTRAQDSRRKRVHRFLNLVVGDNSQGLQNELWNSISCVYLFFRNTSQGVFAVSGSNHFFNYRECHFGSFRRIVWPLSLSLSTNQPTSQPTIQPADRTAHRAHAHAHTHIRTPPSPPLILLPPPPPNSTHPLEMLWCFGSGTGYIEGSSSSCPPSS